MRAQFKMSQAGTLSLREGQTLKIEHAVGEVAVLKGRIWVTRESDLGDHVVEAGGRFMVCAKDVAVIEAWSRSEGVSLAWTPRRQVPPLEAFVRGFAAAGLRGLAAGAAFLAAGLRFGELDALARKAASMARRAQGCICSGESMASAGTVQ